MFCGKDPWKKFLNLSTKISKQVGVPSVEGRKKVHVPYNYTILTLGFSIFYPYRGMDVRNSNQFLPWISLT